MNKKRYKKDSRLIRMVNSFAENRDQYGFSQALENVAEEFMVDLKTVAEAIFPYLSEYERSAMFALKDMLVGAQFIYKARVRRGAPASRMRRYALRAA